jgi:DNA processing protein
MPQELMHQIALTQISQIGDITAKKLLDYFGNASDIFHAKKHQLERIEDVGTIRANAIKSFQDYSRVEKEIAFIEKYKIRPLFYTTPEYPQRLRHCSDSPVLLYFKGQTDFNCSRIINIVGTRQPSGYGREICEQLVAALATHHITIVSGMAYGIDIMAHKAAIQHQITTVGVLAHGLDRIYPAAHKATALQMLENGGLLTDFISGTLPDKQNFPKRNRIVAGICDATIVIESGIRGGSLITADIANSYNRDVMAFPGKVIDPHAAGCNDLIKTNRAILITGAQDVLDIMGWLPALQPAAPCPQRQLFVDLSPQEQEIVKIMQESAPIHIDEIHRQSSLSNNQVANVLLNLQMQSVVRNLPGQVYQLI